MVTASILVITLVSKFTSGGWVTVAITGVVVIISLMIKNHYTKLLKKLEEANNLLMQTKVNPLSTPIPFNPQESTAVIMLEGKNPGVGMYTLLWIQRLFPNKFKNFIFLTVGIVDVESYSAEEKLKTLRSTANETLQYFINYCQQHGFSAKSKLVFGTDPVEKLSELSLKILKECPNSIFFASKLIFEKDNIFKRFLHNEVANSMQRRLHTLGAQLIIVPMKVG
jgi:K+ transporter